jgi:hypothetical protein
VISASDYGAAATEAGLEATIKAWVEYRGGRCFHVTDSRGQDVEDMLDLLIILPPVVALIELKKRRRLTDGQASVLVLLDRCDTVIAGVVRSQRRRLGEWSLNELLAILDEAITEVEHERIGDST